MCLILISLPLALCFQAYGKKIVKDVPLKTRSGPVVYTNLLGFAPMLLLANVSNEYSGFWDLYWSKADYRLPPVSIFLLFLGAIVGTAIGYSSWWCREMVSATSFTLIGGKLEYCLVQFASRHFSLLLQSLMHAIIFLYLSVMNKCLTILLNLLIWDQHAKPGGIFCLFICIVGGMVYQQAPMRVERKTVFATVTADDEEFKADITKDEEMAPLRRGV